MRRREWARARMKQYRDAPIYGSAEWFALSDDDPSKVAAVVRAAECWAVDGTRIAEQLRMELDFRAAFEKQLDDAEYQQRAQAHRDRIRNTSWTPHPANRHRSGGGA